MEESHGWKATLETEILVDGSRMSKRPRRWIAKAYKNSARKYCIYALTESTGVLWKKIPVDNSSIHVIANRGYGDTFGRERKASTEPRRRSNCRIS